MSASKVYFTNLRTKPGESLLSKLKRLMIAAGIETIDFDNKFTAIKMHFGEPGNLSFLRANYVKTVAVFVSSKGGVPFVTDCNVLYVGKRKNAVDHLKVAAENGFSLDSCGCPIIVADGLRGLDEALVPLTGTEYVKEAKIGRAVMDADIIISLNHFKCHEASGIGGAIKNLGMGCGSRAGKMDQHNEGIPSVDASLCKGCGTCSRVCGQDAITVQNGVAVIDKKKCVGCGRCIGACNFDATYNDNSSSFDVFSKKMAEYALAVVQNRPCFHINVVAQVSPLCDCYGGNDAAIIPDVGIFCSFDPVALDTASADACNRQPVLPNTILSDLAESEDCCGHDHFSVANKGTNWRTALEHAEKIGIGTMSYELITVK